jgi:hypothetical protein
MEATMKATVVDLRYRMSDVLKALDRNEDVSILYHGKTKGILTAQVRRTRSKITDHPFFNMSRERGSVAEQMEKLRGGRHRDL